MSDVGLCCINGRTAGDIRGEYTFINSIGKSVIDYVWSDWNGMEVISDLEILDFGSSDHQAQSGKINFL